METEGHMRKSGQCVTERKLPRFEGRNWLQETQCLLGTQPLFAFSTHNVQYGLILIIFTTQLQLVEYLSSYTKLWRIADCIKKLFVPCFTFIPTLSLLICTRYVLLLFHLLFSSTLNYRYFNCFFPSRSFLPHLFNSLLKFHLFSSVLKAVLQDACY